MKNVTRRHFFAGLVATPIVARWGFAVSHSSLMFAGTYTEKGLSRGIYAFQWDAESGTLRALGLAAQSTNPSYLALSPNRRNLYAVNEVNEYQNEATGSVSAFSVEGKSGKLALKNIVSSGGSGPAHVMVDHTGKTVVVSDYAGGSLSSYQVRGDGSLGAMASHFHFTGHGTNPTRQESPHIHSALASPDNRFVLVNDLGLDEIHIFRLDAEKGSLTPNVPPFYRAIDGSGPRDAVFHPNSRWVYSANEMGSSVDALTWDAQSGTLHRFQNVSTLPPGFKGESTASAIAIDRTGKFVYVGNRGADTIAVFAVEPQRGTLAQIQQISSEGKIPRQFSFDPSERWLLAANQNSANIVILKRNPETGHLSSTGRQVSLDSPVCLVFV